MLAVYLFRATSGAHHQEGLVMTLTASSSSRAVTNSPVVVALDYHIVMPRWPLSTRSTHAIVV